MDIKQEDLVRFWTWCGFTQYPEGRKNFHYEQTKKVMDCIAPKGHYGNAGYLPKLELTEIYEYAIPKLQYASLNYMNINYQPKYIAAVNLTNNSEQFYGEADTPVEALFNAIMKVIDNEVK